MAQLVGESVADIALYMIGLATEHCRKGGKGLDAEVDIDRLKSGLGAVVFRHAVEVCRVLVGLDREHLDGNTHGEQTLGDAVHCHRAAVDGRIRGLVAQL